jgi:hypothetical protein
MATPLPAATSGWSPLWSCDSLELLALLGCHIDDEHGPDAGTVLFFFFQRRFERRGVACL